MKQRLYLNSCLAYQIKGGNRYIRIPCKGKENIFLSLENILLYMW